MAITVVPMLYARAHGRPLYEGSPLDTILEKAGRELCANFFTLVYLDVLLAVFTEEELEDLEQDPVYKSGSAGEYILESDKFPEEFKEFIRFDIEADPESDGFEYTLL